jgi:hypothetical protein
MKKISSFVLLVLLSGCAYDGGVVNNKIAKLQQNSLNAGQKDYLKDLDSKPKSKDYLLYNQEAGRIAFILNDTNTSIAKFNNAIAFYKQQEDIARLNASDASKSALSSTLLDDNVLEYKGSDYEKAFVHFYQSINYLKNNNLEKALVEIRASNDAQKFAIASREGKINKAESQIAKYNFSPNIKNALKNNVDSVGDVKSKFLNSAIYYISGNIRELYGDKNGAMVDYKNAYELSPNNSFIVADVLRVSENYDNSYFNNVVKKNPNSKFINNVDYKKQKTILIIYEDHFIPQKKEVGGSVYLFQVDKVANISLPTYDKPYKLSNPTLLFGENTLNLENTTNVYNLATNELSEKYGDILFRQISRLITKMSMQNVGNKINDNDSQEVVLIKLFIGIFGAVSSLAESADLRSFRTLPQQISVLKINTEQDLPNLKLNYNGKYLDLNNLDVKNGELLILYITDTGNAVYYNTIYKGNK